MKHKRVLSFLLMLSIVMTSFFYYGKPVVALQDVIVADNLEGFSVGAKPSSTGAWGANTAIPISVVQETSSNKALEYKGYGSYGIFQSTDEREGHISAEVSLKLPAVFTDFRILITNAAFYGPTNLIFYPDGRATLTQRGADGKETNALIYSQVPINEWFNLKISLDTYNQIQKVFINNVQAGGQYDFRYKLSGVDEPANPTSANNALSKNPKINGIRFANRISTDTDKVFLLDNFKISYDRTILPVSDITTVLDVGDNYQLPSSLPLRIDDGTTRNIAVSWVPNGAELDINKQGIYYYTGTITDYTTPIQLTIDVRKRNIVSIADVSQSTLTTDQFILPSTVTALMDDNSSKDVPVTWDANQVDASVSGYREITGRVDGFSGTVKFKLTIIPREVKSVNRLNLGVKLGEGFTPPTKIFATLADCTTRNVGVTWTSGKVDVNTVGRYYFEGKADGFQDTVYMVVTVYEVNMNDENRMLAVKEFLNNAMTVGRDTTRYGGNLPQILFADAVDVRTQEHMMWKFADGRVEPVSDLANQQVLMRELVGMTNLTGDPKYKQAAADNFKYYFDHFQAQNGLLYWGGHSFVNLAKYQTSADPTYTGDNVTHELKDHFPYYELMFEVDPDKTEKYIKGMWLGHIDDWGTLEFSRHAKMNVVRTQSDFDNIWNKTYLDPPLYFKTQHGSITFLNAAEDYIFAASYLVKYKNDTKALEWMKKLENMYIRGRHPVTKLMGFIFTEDPVGATLPENVFDPTYDFNTYGDRVLVSFPEFESSPYKREWGSLLSADYVLTQYALNPLVLYKMADLSDAEDAKQFEQYAVELEEAFGDYLYDPVLNAVHPSFIDGTRMTGVVPKKYGHFTAYGGVMKPWNLTSDYIIAFSRTYIRSGREKIWQLLRNSINANGLGDIGTAPGVNMALNSNTTCNDPLIVLALLDLYNKYNIPEYLDIAKIIGDNIVKDKFLHGYFVATEKSKYAVLNSVEPYALIALEASIRGMADSVPEFFGKGGYLNYTYLNDDKTTSNIWEFSLFNQSVGAPSSITNLTLGETSVSMKVGEKTQVDVTIEPSDVDDKTVTWESDNPDVAIVNENGEITALKEGKAKITAYAVAGPFYASVDIDVKTP